MANSNATPHARVRAECHAGFLWVDLGPRDEELIRLEPAYVQRLLAGDSAATMTELGVTFLDPGCNEDLIDLPHEALPAIVTALRAAARL